MAKTPKSRFPSGAAWDYFKEVRGLLISSHANVIETFEKKISHNIRNDGLNERNDNAILKINLLLDTLRTETLEYYFDENKIVKIADAFTKSVGNNIVQQFANQFRSVLGVDPIGRDSKLLDIITAANKENIAYIKSIPENYHNNVETVILQGVRRGRSNKQIADGLQEAYKTSRTKAKFIARDQTGSLVADINKAKYEQSGLKGFIWSDVGDGNVRDKHKIFNGKRFLWSEGAGTEGLLPGEDYGCRCTAEVDPDELLNI
ncbi:phage putative head morphogenesis protein, SPP1 gp7 family [Alkaliphilus metalliredigens QYMF]|uniref:Phage putative head morphogenesis protein, SPP1 gp7 family n=1 Tax=Alkaliphilus metalliredigens (strain QYMF) TaxID=293826 RepID=A6TKC7_ALKMQ|nr:minor capsid protein [Alkaliphilus metalliredigens]ABR46645.1 phage putative head morphogenesis protein, SPP1 gp7 family [Alkaliphilus metalliredigens QYMF]ABR48117.1 phage putative head morphogenesis protein, SPP1 gp7 family [Alkaliphilus metalliredigens QYMF]ABR50438.1 phage putative head morphogenesis protein, SPP1 gp7 family [Alkaliphilus metalliredigens QYMF]